MTYLELLEKLKSMSSQRLKEPVVVLCNGDAYDARLREIRQGDLEGNLADILYVGHPIIEAET